MQPLAHRRATVTIRLSTARLSTTLCFALAIFTLALFTSSCAGPVPPVPTPSVEGFDPDVRDAIEAAYKQATTEPENSKASGQLGMVLQAHALNQTAALAYRRAIRLDPKEFAWRYYLALALQQLSKPEEALDALSAALRIRPDYDPAFLRRGDLLLQLGRFPASEDAYESIRKREPGSALALHGLGRVKYAQQDMAAAEDFYRRAVQAYPTFGAAYFGLAEAGRNLGHEAESAKNFELAKRYPEDHPPAEDPLLDQLGELLTGAHSETDRADQLIRNGKMEEAAQLSEATLRRNPENLAALMNVLYLARFFKQYDSDLDSLYARAKRINPQAPQIPNSYGAAMLRQGKYDAAAAALRKAIELKPDFAEAHVWLGEALERQKRPGEALDQYQLALTAEPSNRLARVELGRLLVSRGRSREAIPQLLPAIEVNDSHTSLVLVLLADAYRATGDAAKAQQYLEQALTRVRSEGPPELLAQIQQELKELSSRR